MFFRRVNKARLMKKGDVEFICVDVMVSNPEDEKLKAKVPFIADTGASGCTIPQNLAERLRIRPIGDVEAVMADGRAIPAKWGYALLNVGGRQLYTCVIYGPGFDALLGLDVMHVLRIHLDVAERSLLIPIKYLRMGRLRLTLPLAALGGGRGG